ncbi:YfiT family bacillithiol transferase [Geojedonia litorea]|uniref:YfiT family bacillithiol transferase n=1 Tax=Geojedonia litorea TaxID=1268269 RepID=A0ABV9MYW7_9FLAO
MTNEEFHLLKYPIGELNIPQNSTSQQISEWINEIEQFPEAVVALTKNLSNEQLNWIYRPEGWTIKQVVHHCSDSHMNSLIRFKLALTEDMPTIKPYYEDRWAKLVDGNSNDLNYSLMLLKGLHAKLVILLRSLTPNDLKRQYIHPEHGKRFSLEQTIYIYAWHSKHHLAHIKQALKHKGEF